MPSCFQLSCLGDKLADPWCKRYTLKLQTLSKKRLGFADRILSFWFQIFSLPLQGIFSLFPLGTLHYRFKKVLGVRGWVPASMCLRITLTCISKDQLYPTGLSPLLVLLPNNFRFLCSSSLLSFPYSQKRRRLGRFRSPLLTTSRLISFPQAT